MTESHTSHNKSTTAAVASKPSLDTLALPETLRDPWEAAKAAGHPERMLRALFRVALGETYREAATTEGYVDHAQIWRLAKKHGLIQAGKDAILAGSRRVAVLANDELERRLVDDTENVSTRDVVVAGGVAIDKLSRAEHWDRTGPEQDYAGALREMAEAMKGQTVKLELTVEPAPNRSM